MPAEPLVIVASLWELRAQIEEQLRQLSNAQRLADDILAGDPAPNASQFLHQRLQAVVACGVTVSEMATNCLRRIEDLP